MTSRSSCLVAILLLVPISSAAEGWVQLLSPVVTPLYAAHFTDASTGYVVGAAGIGLKTTDAGDSWQLMTTGTTNDLHDAEFIGDVGVAVGKSGTIIRTVDAGDTWLPSLVPVTEDLHSVSLAGDVGVCGGTSQTVLYTIDGGVSWQISQTGFFGGGFFGAVMLGSNVAFVGGQNSIFQPMVGSSSDGGQTWTFNVFYLDGNEGSVSRIDFTDELIGYAASRVWDFTGAISRTMDGGLSWSTTLFPEALFGIDFASTDVGYAVGQNGQILKTTTAGNEWYAQDGGSPTTFRDVAFVDADTGYVVGDDGVILRTTTGGERTTNANDSSVEATSDLLFFRARPNPFVAATTLEIDLAKGERGTIDIFDAAGKRVRVLTVIGTAGEPALVSWNGRNEMGHRVAPGVYYARIATGTGHATGVVVRIR